MDNNRVSKTNPGNMISADIKNSQDNKVDKKTVAKTVAVQFRENELPKCEHYACFAFANGHCTILYNTDFGGRPCPFYKSKFQVEKERQDAYADWDWLEW